MKKDAASFDMLERAKNKLEKPMSANVENTMKVALKQSQEYTLYTNKAFSKGIEVRAVLEKTLMELELSDRDKAMAEIRIGKSREEALVPFLADHSFEEWTAELKRELESVLSN